MPCWSFCLFLKVINSNLFPTLCVLWLWWTDSKQTVIDFLCYQQHCSIGFSTFTNFWKMQSSFGWTPFSQVNWRLKYSYPLTNFTGVWRQPKSTWKREVLKEGSSSCKHGISAAAILLTIASLKIHFLLSPMKLSFKCSESKQEQCVVTFELQTLGN